MLCLCRGHRSARQQLKLACEQSTTCHSLEAHARGTHGDTESHARGTTALAQRTPLHRLQGLVELHSRLLRRLGR